MKRHDEPDLLVQRADLSAELLSKLLALTAYGRESLRSDYFRAAQY